MEKISFIGLILLLIVNSCEKVTENIDKQYNAKIVGYNYCSKCIIAFQDNSLALGNAPGERQNNYYQTVNLNKNDFKIGQVLTVRVRNARDNEIMPCIAHYPSLNYEYLFILDYVNCRDFEYNDTIYLPVNDCLFDHEKQGRICFDSVLTDSRCPVDATCIWAGEAIARFKIEKFDSNPIFVDLHTGTIDTVVQGYNISFIDLLPYPTTEHQIDPGEYKARIVIK